MKTQELLDSIHYKKSLLDKLLEQKNGNIDEEVLKLSTEIDRLMNEYYKLLIGGNP